LRYVDAFPVDQDGERFLALRDPAGFTASVLLLPIAAVEIVRLFDGRHSIVDIQGDITSRTGEIVFGEAIERMIGMLDEHGFLDSPTFATRRAGIEQSFLEALMRPASHAGGAYAADPAELRGVMDTFF